MFLNQYYAQKYIQTLKRYHRLLKRHTHKKTTLLQKLRKKLLFLLKKLCLKVGSISLIGLSFLPFMVSAQIEAGNEFQVNQATLGSQEYPSTAMNNNGDFVVVWTGLDASGEGIFGRLYHSDGSPASNEFQVNQDIESTQFFPQVAMDDNGDFVVVWRNFFDISARKYAADGTPLSDEFQVNLETETRTYSPHIDMYTDGSFIIVWIDDQSLIKGKLYNSAAVPVSNELNLHQGDIFTLNIDAENDQGFIITWSDGTVLNSQVWVRKFDGDGNPNTGAIQVSPDENSHSYSDVSLDSNGDFVVAWQELSYDEEGGDPIYNVYARQYNQMGQAESEHFLVNQVTYSWQMYPYVGNDESGNFTITWDSLLQDGSGYGIYARQYNWVAEPLSDEFLVNQETIDWQEYPRISMNNAGDFVIVWHSHDQDGDDNGIYGRYYRSRPNHNPTDVFLSNNAIQENNAPGLHIGDFSTEDEDNTDTHTYTLVNGLGDEGNNHFYLQDNQLFARSTFDYEALNIYSIRVRSTDQHGGFFEKIFNINILDINEIPLALSLNNNSIRENNNDGDVIGLLSTLDDENDTHTYTLIDGEGSEFNDLFSIIDNRLLARSIFDFESQSVFLIRVRSTDQNGLSIERVLNIHIEDINEAPTDILLSNSIIKEKRDPGTEIGNLTTIDQDFNDFPTYILSENVEVDGQPLFEITDKKLIINQFINTYEDQSYQIKIRSTDSGGLFFEKTFEIKINNIEEQRIFPNPNKGDYFVNLYGLDFENSTITLYNQYGVRVWSDSFTKNQDGVLIPIHTPLPQGTYIIDIRMNKARLLKKVVII